MLQPAGATAGAAEQGPTEATTAAEGSAAAAPAPAAAAAAAGDTC